MTELCTMKWKWHEKSFMACCEEIPWDSPGETENQWITSFKITGAYKILAGKVQRKI